MVFERLKNFDKQFRFLIVGGINTIFGFSIYPLIYLLTRGFDIFYVWVLVPSQIIAVSFSFATYKYFVYKTSGNHIREYGKFSFFHVVMFTLNLLALPLLVEGFGINPMIAQTIFSFLVVSTSYIWYQKIAFKNR
jgi:putative flippase GtrA